jgi:hypothetical protein
MLKHHKLISFCFGLLFLIVMQKFASPEPVFRYLTPAFVAYTALLAIYNRWYLNTIQKFNIWVWLRPILFLFSAFGFFLILPNEFLRGLFLILCVGLITLFEVILENIAENILLNETLIIAFGMFFAFFGLYNYAPGYQPFYLVGVFLGSTLLARSFYEFCSSTQKAKITGAIAIGLFSGELFWALNFLHFHYSVLSIFLFNFFYFCLILNYYHLFHNLNFKKIQLHLFLIMACFFAVLISTPWRIVG